MCFNSVLIPTWIGVPWIFFLFELHQNGIFFASFEVQFVVINYSFETEFWYIYVLYWINLLLRVFFLARDRSLKLNTSFPVLYTSMKCQCIMLLNYQGYRQTCVPLLKLEGACDPSFLGPRFESIQRCLTQAGPSVPPPPSQKLLGARVPSFRRSSLACYKFRDVWRLTCAPPPFLNLWEGHVLPSPLCF